MEIILYLQENDIFLIILYTAILTVISYKISIFVMKFFENIVKTIWLFITFSFCLIFVIYIFYMKDLLGESSIYYINYIKITIYHQITTFIKRRIF